MKSEKDESNLDVSESSSSIDLEEYTKNIQKSENKKGKYKLKYSVKKNREKNKEDKSDELIELITNLGIKNYEFIPNSTTKPKEKRNNCVDVRQTTLKKIKEDINKNGEKFQYNIQWDTVINKNIQKSSM